jgi:hypothetical protein
MNTSIRNGPPIVSYIFVCVAAMLASFTRVGVVCAQDAVNSTEPPTTNAHLSTFKQIEEIWGKASLDDVKKAAESGDAIAQCHLGARFIAGRIGKTNFTEGFSWYLKAAEQGVAHAQFRLGMMCAQGQGVPKNREAAMKWMSKSAEQGYTLGELNLGWLHANDEAAPGRTPGGNYPEAAEWYEKAAKKGNAHAQFLLAELYHYQKLGAAERTNCIQWYLKSAAQGHVKAQAEVGRLPSSFPNHPLLKTNHAVVTFLRNAAEKGNLDAQFELAKKYRAGDGVETNLVEAFKWMQRAAQSDVESSRSSDAAYELARMYENGEGVQRNPTEAWNHYQAAAAGGYPDALYRVAVMYDQGTGVPRDLKQATEYYFLAATRGWGSFPSNAVDRLLQLYADGQGLPQDAEEIDRQLKHFANAQIPRIQFQLGEIRYQGKAVPKDDGAAVEHYTRAAKLGFAEAQNRIGQLWAAGLQGTPDLQEAASWYLKAAVQGLAEAQFNLGALYAKGTGVKPDPVEAWHWLYLALSQEHPNGRKALEELEKRMTPEQIGQAKAKAAEFKPSKPVPRPWVFH